MKQHWQKCPSLECGIKVCERKDNRPIKADRNWVGPSVVSVRRVLAFPCHLKHYRFTLHQSRMVQHCNLSPVGKSQQPKQGSLKSEAHKTKCIVINSAAQCIHGSSLSTIMGSLWSQAPQYFTIPGSLVFLIWQSLVDYFHVVTVGLRWGWF